MQNVIQNCLVYTCRVREAGILLLEFIIEIGIYLQQFENAVFQHYFYSNLYIRLCIVVTLMY